jgi:hypothetical protein
MDFFPAIPAIAGNEQSDQAGPVAHPVAVIDECCSVAGGAIVLVIAVIAE